MSEQRKISVRKIIQSAVTLVLLSLCVFVMLGASDIQDTHTLKGIDISIQNEDVCQFVNKDEVKDILLKKRHINLKHTKISAVDVHKMEHILAANPWIDTVQVFVDNKRRLHVDLAQRVPELRVFERDGSSYYLDRSQHVLPLSDRYSHYELVFVQVPHFNSDSLNEIMRTKLLRIAYLIKRDEFWNAQTAEVAVNSIDDFELVPVMGKQRIRIGDTTDLQEKLDNLMAFYRHIQRRIGWNRYEVLDIRFKDQVVASPALPWKAPVDRALSNMNWVKTIIGNETVQEQKAAYPLTASATAVTKPSVQATPVVQTKPVVKSKPVLTPAKPVQHTAAAAKKPAVKHTATAPAAKQATKKTTQPKAVMPGKQHNQ